MLTTAIAVLVLVIESRRNTAHHIVVINAKETQDPFLRAKVDTQFVVYFDESAAVDLSSLALGHVAGREVNIKGDEFAILVTRSSRDVVKGFRCKHR